MSSSSSESVQDLHFAIGAYGVSQPVLSTFGFIGLLSQLSDNNLRPISVHPGYSSSDLSAGFLALFSSEFRDFRHCWFYAPLLVF